MSLRLNPCLAAVFLCLTGGLCRAAPDAHALVDEILANPGHFQQACSFFAIMDGQEMPLPVNGVLARGEHRISTENFARLRRTRAGIVADLTERLKGIDTGTNWKSSAAPLNGNVLMMLLDLNATEALPELLRIEAILRTKIGQSPSQTAAGHNNEEITLRLLQRNILGVIATILRQERFGPFLESRVEKDYHHALKKNASAPGLKFLKNDAELTPDQLNYVYFDPIYGLPASSFTAFEVPCNDATVKQVISFAETYLKEVPASDRKGAAGMLVRPVTR